MELLTSFYDEVLIYAPNAFFATVLVVGIVGIYYLTLSIIRLSRFIKEVAKSTSRESDRKRLHHIVVRLCLTIGLFLYTLFAKGLQWLDRIAARAARYVYTIGLRLKKEMFIEESKL